VRPSASRAPRLEAAQAPTPRVRASPSGPPSRAARRQDVWLTAEDGTKLHAWYLHPRTLPSAAQRRGRPAVLFLQENAGNMALRLPFLRLLARYLDASVLALRPARRAPGSRALPLGPCLLGPAS